MAVAQAATRFHSRKLMVQLQATLLWLICFSAPAAPRALTALVGVLGIAAAVHVIRTDRTRLIELVRTPVGVALGAFIAYLFVNAIWAPDQVAALTKAAGTLGLVAAAFLIASSFSLREVDETKLLAKAAVTGLLAGLAFLVIELAFDEPIKRFITNHIVQLFDLTPKKMKIEHGEVTRLRSFVLNRNMVSLVLLLIPGLLFARALPMRPTRNLVVTVLLLGAASCILTSESGTSVIALVLGAVAIAASALSLKGTRVVLMAVWTAVMLLAVPLSALPYNLGWNSWTFLPPQSVAARFYIWKHMADAVSAHPIGGIGIRGARELDVRLPADSGDLDEAEPTPDGRKVPHPHNIYLQVWLELGVIGALLVLGVGLAALWQIRLLPRWLQAGANGLFAVCAGVAATGFDLWQTWLLGGFVFAWVAFVLAVYLPEPAGGRA